MYPTEKHPVYGIFVKEQMEDIVRATSCKADLFFINAREQGKLEYLKSIFSLPRKIRKGGYDLIHIHYGFSGLFLLLFRPFAKVLLTLHGADILIKQEKKLQVAVTKKILPKVDQVFTLSKEMEGIVGAITDRFETLPCGVNTDLFRIKDLANEPKDEWLILFPGAPEVEVKNFPLFEQTLALLKEKLSKPVRFAFVKNLTREGVSDLMNKADCLLMTSISEGSPQVVKESLACGLPVVSVPVGDVKEMVSGIPNSFVSQTREANELCELVLQALGGDREDIRKAFLDKGFYDHQSVTRRLVDHYSRLLGHPIQAEPVAS